MDQIASSGRFTVVKGKGRPLTAAVAQEVKPAQPWATIKVDITDIACFQFEYWGTDAESLVADMATELACAIGIEQPNLCLSQGDSVHFNRGLRDQPLSDQLVAMLSSALATVDVDTSDVSFTAKQIPIRPGESTMTLTATSPTTP